MDPAAAGERSNLDGDRTGRSAVVAVTHSTNTWQVYVRQLYDPTLDDIQDVSEPEICRILGERSESSAQLRAASSQRFAVRGVAAGARGRAAERAARSARASAPGLPRLACCCPQDVSATVPRKEDCGSFVPILSLRSLAPGSEEDDEEDEDGEEASDDEGSARAEAELVSDRGAGAAEAQWSAAGLVGQQQAAQGVFGVASLAGATCAQPTAADGVDGLVTCTLWGSAPSAAASMLGPSALRGPMGEEDTAEEGLTAKPAGGALLGGLAVQSPGEAAVHSQLASLFREGDEDVRQSSLCLRLPFSFITNWSLLCEGGPKNNSAATCASLSLNTNFPRVARTALRKQLRSRTVHKQAVCSAHASRTRASCLPNYYPYGRDGLAHTVALSTPLLSKSLSASVYPVYTSSSASICVFLAFCDYLRMRNLLHMCASLFRSFWNTQLLLLLILTNRAGMRLALPRALY